MFTHLDRYSLKSTTMAAHVKYFSAVKHFENVTQLNVTRSHFALPVFYLLFVRTSLTFRSFTGEVLVRTSNVRYARTWVVTGTIHGRGAVYNVENAPRTTRKRVFENVNASFTRNGDGNIRRVLYKSRGKTDRQVPIASTVKTFCL